MFYSLHHCVGDTLHTSMVCCAIHIYRPKMYLGSIAALVKCLFFSLVDLDLGAVACLCQHWSLGPVSCRISSHWHLGKQVCRCECEWIQQVRWEETALQAALPYQLWHEVHRGPYCSSLGFLLLPDYFLCCGNSMGRGSADIVPFVTLTAGDSRGFLGPMLMTCSFWTSVIYRTEKTQARKREKGTGLLFLVFF